MSQAEQLSFDQFIRHWARERPGNTALEQDDDALTFGELDIRSRKIVAMLAARGVGKGDRIAENSIQIILLDLFYWDTVNF